MGLSAMWQGMKDVAGSRDQAMMGLKKAFGTYNYAEDPEYQRDMQLLSQNPTQQALGAFYEKWEDNLDGKTLQDVASGLSYVKSTPQWTQQQINENKLIQSNIKTEAMPELTEIDLGLARNNLAQSDINTRYAPKFTEQRFMQNEQSLEQGQQSIDENNIRLKYLEPQIKQQLTSGEIANDINKLQLEYKRETDPIRKQLLQNDLTLANETLRDKIALSGLQVNNTRANLRQNESAARVAEGTEEFRISNAQTQAEINALNKTLFDETFEAQANAPYIQNASRILSNNNQVTQNRILNETADNQITQSNLETELLRLQQEQAQDKYNFNQSLDPNVRYGVETGTGNEPAIDIKEVLPTPEGVPQLALNSADTVVYAQSGEPYVDANGKAYVAQSTMYGNDRTFQEVDPNSYLSGGTGNKYDFKKTGNEEDEQGWAGRTWDSIISNITGNNQSNNTQTQPGQWNDSPKYQPKPVINQLMKDNGAKTPQELLSMLNNSSPNAINQIEDAYGYSLDHLNYILSNM